MIQRIQSLYLFIAGTAVALMFFFPVAKIEKLNEAPDNASAPHRFYEITLTGKHELLNGQTTKIENYTINTLLGTIILIGSFACLFLYRNRMNQMRICRINLLLATLLLVMVFTSLMTELADPGLIRKSYEIGAYLLSITIVFTFLATRAIQKDENLVRAADRLR